MRTSGWRDWACLRFAGGAGLGWLEGVGELAELTCCNFGVGENECFGRLAAILFRGVANSRHYLGTACNFMVGCPPSPYAVSGMSDDKKEIIVLTGGAPHRDPRSCQMIETANRSVQSLVFETHIDGDE